jgi:type II secretory pathway component PulK
VDAERKFNINLAAQYPELLRQALILMGIDAVESPAIVNAISDWIDRDDNARAGSSDTESSYYLSLKPPYAAKNGPIDDLTELMLVKGISAGMYWGSGASGGGTSQRYIPLANRFNRRMQEEPAYPIGFVDLFTTISLPTININTASSTVLQLIPDVDENMASAIIQTRAGPTARRETKTICRSAVSVKSATCRE